MFLAKHTHQQSHCLTTESDLSCTPVLQYYWVLLSITEVLGQTHPANELCFPEDHMFLQTNRGCISHWSHTTWPRESTVSQSRRTNKKKTVLRLMLICSNTWKCKKKKVQHTQSDWRRTPWGWTEDGAATNSCYSENESNFLRLIACVYDDTLECSQPRRCIVYSEKQMKQGKYNKLPAKQIIIID